MAGFELVSDTSEQASADREERAFRIRSTLRRWNIRSNRWSKLNRTTRLGEITFHRGNAALSLRRPATWRFRCVHRRARCPTSLVRVSSDARFIGRCVYSTTPPTKYVPSIRSLPFFFPWKSLDYDFFYYFIVDIGV